MTTKPLVTEDVPSREERLKVILTPREHEVWRLACAGLSARSIATTLGISRTSVRDHQRSAAVKIRAHGLDPSDVGGK